MTIIEKGKRLKVVMSMFLNKSKGIDQNTSTEKSWRMSFKGMDVCVTIRGSNVIVLQ